MPGFVVTHGGLQQRRYGGEHDGVRIWREGNTITVDGWTDNNFSMSLGTADTEGIPVKEFLDRLGIDTKYLAFKSEEKDQH